ncbi:hypothetical protein [Shewanella gaetbuli]|uniref:DUF481 domain-containing protein n=1 Tax=Shewanella gaetbuli TaxID=220752 RepID=A0A9X1ZME1_9GAMM|nr:hypothetical protein [Shewanella gaetbuli]MCL1143637.1 hypothetical protein [Shewanella gaetbuli]
MQAIKLIVYCSLIWLVLCCNTFAADFSNKINSSQLPPKFSQHNDRQLHSTLGSMSAVNLKTNTAPKVGLSIDKYTVEQINNRYPFSQKVAVGLHSQWALFNSIVIDSYIKQLSGNQLSPSLNNDLLTHQLAPQIDSISKSYQIEENVLQAQQDAFIGSGITLHNLLNNKLIVGMNYQLSINEYDFTSTSSQSINTYINYQVINNLNVNFDWIMKDEPSVDNLRTNLTDRRVPTNDIDSHFLLISVSYKM